MSQTEPAPHEDIVPTSPDDTEPESGETWDEVRTDYQVEPDGDPVPNSMDAAEFKPVDDRDEADE